jgi:hypothetical protein
VQRITCAAPRLLQVADVAEDVYILCSESLHPCKLNVQRTTGAAQYVAYTESLPL